MLVGVAVLAAACGGGGGETVVASGEAIVAPLAYEYVGGERVTYSFDGTVDMEMTAEGTGALAAGADADDMKMGVDFSGEMTIETAEGDEPGTTELTISMDVADFTVREATMGGESIPGGTEFVDSGAFDFPESTIVVDEQGNVVSVRIGGEELPAAFAAASGSLGPAGSGLDPAMFFNPAFPEGDLTVGSEWEIADTVDLPGMGTLRSHTTNQVTETFTKQGHDLFRVQSVTTLDSIEFDLFEMMQEMAASDPASAEMLGDPGAFFPEGMEMKMALEPAEITGDTWFDATSGMVARAHLEMPMDMSVAMTMPGEGSIQMDATISMAFDVEFISRTTTG